MSLTSGISRSLMHVARKDQREALVRWPRRPAGELGPDTFISIAETSGLIYKLGQFVLHRACGI
jgi:predicted signal transduction protein with EAL and GGDEF domain